MVLTAAYLAINSTDWSDTTSKVELVVEVDEQDMTTFSSSGWKEFLGGLKAGTLSITFKQDIADNDLDESLWALLGTVTTFEVRLTQSAASASNPKYTGSVLIKEWKPIMGAVGDGAEVEVSWPTSAAVTRGTS
jgi:hypothetical protein